MRLTASLLYYVNRRKIPGKVTIGKYRIWPKIRNNMKFVAAHDLVREHENMEILSRPFLTEEEDKVYLEAVEEKWRNQVKEHHNKKLASRVPPHFTTQETLAHLDANKSWM